MAHMISRVILALIALPALTIGADRIASIDFYGYDGIDLPAVRAALPVVAGAELADDTADKISAAIKRATGLDATEVAAVCCDQHGATYLFIGLPGKSTREFRLNPKPTGKLRLSPELLGLLEKLGDAFFEAVKKGGDAPVEDDSRGFPMINYPPARQLQTQIREYALAHETEIYAVLERSADDYQRDQAAKAAGYTQQSPRQIEALMRATRDRDKGVRDESTRALGVLLRSGSSFAQALPSADFIDMMWSGTWMDRNKASMMLDLMTQLRDPKLLQQVRAGAWQPLLEMSAWQDASHAYFGRMILGRMQGIPEERLHALAMLDSEQFLAAMGPVR